MKGKSLSGILICIVVSIVIMFAFTGCNPDTPEPTTGILTVKTSDKMPVGIDYDKYIVTVLGGTTSKTVEFGKDDAIDFEVAPGTYEVVVEVKKGDDIVGRGTSSIKVGAVGKTEECPIDLRGVLYVSANNGNDGNDGVKGTPYQTVAKALENSGISTTIGTIYIMDNITEDISIGKSITMIGSGDSPVTVDSDNYTVASTTGSPVTISGNMTISASNVSLENLKIDSSTKSTEPTIKLTNASGVSFAGSHLYIVPAAAKNGITYSENLTGTVSIALDNSVIEMSGANEYDHVGILVDGTAGNHQYASKPGIAKVSFIASSIEANQGLGLDLKHLSKADLTIDQSKIYIGTNYYSVRFYDVGAEGFVRSTAVVKNSYLRAWGAFYIQGDSYNIDSTISNCFMTGYNNNTGTTNDFCTIPLDSSTNCTAVIENSTIQFGRLANAEEQLAADIYYYDNTGKGGCSIDFKNDTLEWIGDDGEIGPVVFSAATITKRAGTPTNFPLNTITVDSATIQSLTGQGYEMTPNETTANRTDLFIPRKQGGRTPDSTTYEVTTKTISFTLLGGTN